MERAPFQHHIFLPAAGSQASAMWWLMIEAGQSTCVRRQLPRTRTLFCSVQGCFSSKQPWKSGWFVLIVKWNQWWGGGGWRHWCEVNSCYALTKDQNSVPSTRARQLSSQTLVTPASGDQMSLDSKELIRTHLPTYLHTDTHTHTPHQGGRDSERHRHFLKVRHIPGCICEGVVTRDIWYVFRKQEGEYLHPALNPESTIPQILWSR